MEPTDRHFTRITRRQFMGSAVLLAGGGLLAACAQPATTSTSPPPKGEAPSTGGGNVPGPAAQSAKVASPSAERVIIGMDAEPVIMDPHQIREVTSRRCAQPVFESLLQYNSDTFALEPALAEKWDVSPDGLSYTFYLRKGVKFHDDTPFNAQAVKFSFDRPAQAQQRPGQLPLWHVPMEPHRGGSGGGRHDRAIPVEGALVHHSGHPGQPQLCLDHQPSCC